MLDSFSYLLLWTTHISLTSVISAVQLKLISYSVSDYQNDSSGKESVATATTSTRTSKWNETNFSWPGARVVSSCRAEDSDKQVLRMAGDWPGSVQTTPLLHTKTDTARHQPPSHLDRSSALGPALDRGNLLSPSKSEHQYDVPWSHLLPRKQLTVDTGQQQEAQVTSAPPPGPPPGGNDYSDIVPEASRQRASPWSVSDTSLSMSSNSGSMAAGKQSL